MTLRYRVGLASVVAVGSVFAASGVGVAQSSGVSAARKQIKVLMNPKSGVVTTISGAPARVVLDPKTGRVLSVARPTQ